MLEILGYGLCGLLMLIGTIPIFITTTSPRTASGGAAVAAWLLLVFVALGALVLGVSINEQADLARQAMHAVPGVS